MLIKAFLFVYHFNFCYVWIFQPSAIRPSLTGRPIAPAPATSTAVAANPLSNAVQHTVIPRLPSKCLSKTCLCDKQNDYGNLKHGRSNDNTHIIFLLYC